MTSWLRWSLVGVAVFSSSLASAQVVSDALTTRAIAEFSPRARADLVDALVGNKNLLAEAGIETSSQFFHFMSQIAAETGGFITIEENMNYSADRLRVIFGKYVKTDAHARELERKPVAIANWVYGGRLGNRGQDTMDGWNYRGSGFIQLTGRDNYLQRGNEIGLSLADNPERARRPKEGLQAAVAYWEAKCNEMADAASIQQVRRCVNGGKHGLDQAKLWHGRAVRVFGPFIFGAGLESENLVSQGITYEIDAAKDILQNLGYFEPSGLESADDQSAFQAAIEQFSVDRGLPYRDSSQLEGGLEAPEQEGLPENLLYGLTSLEILIEEREVANTEGDTDTDTDTE